MNIKNARFLLQKSATTFVCLRQPIIVLKAAHVFQCAYCANTLTLNIIERTQIAKRIDIQQ